MLPAGFEFADELLARAPFANELVIDLEPPISPFELGGIVRRPPIEPWLDALCA